MLSPAILLSAFWMLAMVVLAITAGWLPIADPEALDLLAMMQTTKAHFS